jgi:hypothetical protein
MQTLQAQYLDHLGVGMGQSLILREIIFHYGITPEKVSEALIMGFSDEDIEQFGIFLRRASANVHHVLHSPPSSSLGRFIKNPDI